ncbi:MULTISPECIES: hypothetical protein [Wolbachia]|nr:MULTISPECIES: hypothetical protein [Wolbachia]MDX5507551.1 hypothetical protein [Wolbachia endosymbiont of Hylaeus sinuatus]RLT61652.1 hypothetical protein WANA31_0261 [Wolbachia endosymbiont of Drosophila ananassae]
MSRTGMTPICSYSCLFSSTLFCHSAEQIHKESGKLDILNSAPAD